MALLHSCLNLLYSTMALLDYNWLYSIDSNSYHCSMALLDSTSSTIALSLTLLDFIPLYHGSTWLYTTVLHCTMAPAIMALLDSSSLYLTLHHCTINISLVEPASLYHSSTSLYLILYHSTMALHSTWGYVIVPWLYLTLHHSTMADMTLLDCVSLCHGSTSLYFIVLRLYLAQLDSTSLSHDPTWLYLTLHHCTMALLYK